MRADEGCRRLPHCLNIKHFRTTEGIFSLKHRRMLANPDGIGIMLRLCTESAVETRRHFRDGKRRDILGQLRIEGIQKLLGCAVPVNMEIHDLPCGMRACVRSAGAENLCFRTADFL